MKLYDSKLAPNPRRVRIFLAEKGIAVPTEQVDIARRTVAKYREQLGILPSSKRKQVY